MIIFLNNMKVTSSESTKKLRPKTELSQLFYIVYQASQTENSYLGIY